MKKIHFEWTFSFAIGLTVLSLTIAIATQQWVVKNYRINGSQKSFDAIVDALDQLLKDTPQQELFESKIYFYLKQLAQLQVSSNVIEQLFHQDALEAYIHHFYNFCNYSKFQFEQAPDL